VAARQKGDELPREYAIPVVTPLGKQLKWVTKEEAEKMARGKDGLTEEEYMPKEETYRRYGPGSGETPLPGEAGSPEQSQLRKDLDALLEEEPYAAPRAPKNEAEELIGAMSAGIAELMDIPPTDSGLEYAESIVREMIQMGLSDKGEKLEPRYFSGPGQAETPEDEMKAKLAATLVDLLEWPGSDVDYDIAETVVRKVLDGVK
jgi:hypothetical protein